jgi:hypothetical protein
MASLPWRHATEIFVPRAIDGRLHYTLMEIIPTGDPSNYWTLRLKVPQPQIPANPEHDGSFMPPTGIPHPYPAMG